MQPEKAEIEGTCDCSVSHKIQSQEGDNLESIYHIPRAAYGYIDPVTGKQLGSFMTYLIINEGETVRRRYSDFELLVTHFNRVYPSHVIPPIPAKHSVAASISSLFGKSKETQNMVDYRVRAFGNFLQIVLHHPILRLDHVFHLFISKPDATWKMEIVKYTINPLKPIHPPKLPKNMDAGLRSIYDILGSFEEKAKQLNTQQKLILRRLKDIQYSMEGLGSQYNSFSLEFELLASLLDSVGELHDSDAFEMSEVVGKQELLCEVVNDLNLYIDAVKRALAYFMGMLVEMEGNQEIINQLRAGILESKEDDPNASSLPLKEEIQKALGRKVEKNRENLWKELGIWLQRIRGQWHLILTQLSQSQVKSLQTSYSNWSTFQKK